MKSIVVANWKMNPATAKDAKKLFEATKRAADAVKNVTVVVAPPAIYLRELSSGYKGKRISFGAQNASAEPSGAFTGEMSLSQARDAKAAYVIVGHGERRAMGESNADTTKKMAAAVALKMTPVLCVGEKERMANGEHFSIVRKQLTDGLAEITASKLKQIMVMYEPLWAVGSGNPVTAGEMHEMLIFIKKTLVEHFGDVAMSTRILYGGSVNAENARPMVEIAGVSGFIVGGVSLNAATFKALLESLQEYAVHRRALGSRPEGQTRSFADEAQLASICRWRGE
jgi:triosephosphate isomerase